MGLLKLCALATFNLGVIAILLIAPLPCAKCVLVLPSTLLLLLLHEIGHLLPLRKRQVRVVREHYFELSLECPSATRKDLLASVACSAALPAVFGAVLMLAGISEIPIFLTPFLAASLLDLVSILEVGQSSN